MTWRWFSYRTTHIKLKHLLFCIHFCSFHSCVYFIMPQPLQQLSTRYRIFLLLRYPPEIFLVIFFSFFSVGKQLNLTSSCHISWIITSFHGFCILSPISSVNWCESDCHISNGNGLRQMLRQSVDGWMEIYRNNLPEGDNHKNNNNNNRISMESKLWFQWFVDVDNFLNTNEFRRHYFGWNFPSPNFYDFSIRQSNMCVLLRCSRIEILEIQIAIEIPRIENDVNCRHSSLVSALYVIFEVNILHVIPMTDIWWEKVFKVWKTRSDHIMADQNMLKRTHGHTLMGYNRTYVSPVTTTETLVLKTPICCAKQFRWLNVMECVVICTYWLWVSMSIAIQIVSNRNQNIHR